MEPHHALRLCALACYLGVDLVRPSDAKAANRND
jgi:hypothetical protein